MILSKDNLKNIKTTGLPIPTPEMFDLPEKVLQFGTGVLLRGLPDYFIDKANRNGVFNGRIVVIKSTDKGSTADFDQQDNLYTLYAKGIENGREVYEEVICSAISRVLSATNDWAAILEVAKSPDLELIISNTTEMGIQLVKEAIGKQSPASYPGKLLAILYERYKAFNGSADSGLIIIPTELIVDNGPILRSIVLELAHFNNLEPEFIHWLTGHTSFCSSLVDRIVPGKPDKDSAALFEAERGYTDNLHITSETYSLWAIEGDKKIADALSFGSINKGMVVTPDIELFRELKLRLLNGSHTLSCAVAFLSGFETVKEAMDNPGFANFINQLAFTDILHAIPYNLEPNIAADFAGNVLDRFRNPYIRHEWLTISVNYTTKIKMRVLPLLLNHYKLTSSVPENIAIGFAAYIMFMNGKPQDDGSFKGWANNNYYMVSDNHAGYFSHIWGSPEAALVVEQVLNNKDLWDTDLTTLPGFKDAVTTNLKKIMSGGINQLIAV